MEEQRSHRMQKILHRTLEIISLLYGESFTIMKIGGRVNMMVPEPRSTIRDLTDEEKILEAINKVIELLTGEGGRASDGHVVVKEENTEGGVLENAGGDKVAMMEDQPTDGSWIPPKRSPWPLCSWDSTEEGQETPQQGQDLMHVRVMGEETSVRRGQSRTEEGGWTIKKGEEETSVWSDYPPAEETGQMMTIKKEEEEPPVRGHQWEDGKLKSIKQEEVTSVKAERFSAEESGMVLKVKVGERSRDADTAPQHDVMSPAEERLALYPEDTMGGEDDAAQISGTVKSSMGNINPELSISERPPDPSPPEEPSSDVSCIVTQTAGGGAGQTILFSGRVYRQILPLKPTFVIHQKSPSGGKLFQCLECGREYTVQRSFERHLRFHTGENMLKCSECGKLFEDKHNLASHQRVHTGERPFPCLECGARFKKKSTLNGHMKTHTGEKPFACSTCDFRCGRKSRLISHFRTHARAMVQGSQVAPKRSCHLVPKVTANL